MDLKDAALILASESADHPAVALVAQSAYDRLVQGELADYRVLNDLLGEASGKGVLRALHRKYSPTAYEAIIMPICQEIGGKHRSGRGGGHRLPRAARMIRSPHRCGHPAEPRRPVTRAVSCRYTAGWRGPGRSRPGRWAAEPVG